MHCLTIDVFAIFQLVGFDRRQACLHPAALKSCEKHLIGRCEQFNIRDFCLTLTINQYNGIIIVDWGDHDGKQEKGNH